MSTHRNRRLKLRTRTSIIGFLALASSATTLIADTPPSMASSIKAQTPESLILAWAPDKRFYAARASNALAERGLTVHTLREDAHDDELYSMSSPYILPVTLHLSNDGQLIAIVNPVSEVNRGFDYARGIVVFNLYRQGHLIAEIKLGDIISSDDEMLHEPDGTSVKWGWFHGFTSKGSLTVQIAKTEKILVYDESKKLFAEQPTAEAASPAK